MKVLGMDMEGVRHQASSSLSRVFVYNQEIAHVQEYAEIRVVHTVNELFHTLAVLTKIAMIFHHSLYAQFRPELSDCPAAFNENGQGLVKTPGSLFAGRPAPGRIMAHAR